MTLPKPPREVPVETSLDGLCPRFRAAIERVLEELRKAGFDPIVSESTRTQERQDYLYGFGRDYDDGRGVVTKVRRSWHLFGLAVDIISKSHGWDAPRAFWDALRAAAELEGLVSGGSWKRQDLPHVQWGAPMRESPSERATQLYAESPNRLCEEVKAA